MSLFKSRCVCESLRDRVVIVMTSSFYTICVCIKAALRWPIDIVWPHIVVTIMMMMTAAVQMMIRNGSGGSGGGGGDIIDGIGVLDKGDGSGWTEVPAVQFNSNYIQLSRSPTSCKDPVSRWCL